MSIVCKAAIAYGDGQYGIEKIEVGQPKEDEVLVKVKAAGLCHTDHDSLTWGKPVVLGHEGSGIVEKAGSEVIGLEEGDAVILNWATPCYQCHPCQHGYQNLCQNNSPVVAGANGFTPGHAHIEGTTWKGESIERSFNIGTLSEYTLVKSSALVKNHSKKLPFDAASILSCGVMTGYGSVVNSAKFITGSSAVVLGTGGVGLSVIQGAKISGASMIIAIDINENRLKLAAQFGATHTILAEKEDTGLLKAAEKVKQLTGGFGADYAFECTAVSTLGAAPLAMIRNAGTAVQVSGIEEEITIDMRLFEWDKTYINPLYGKCNPQVDFPKLVDLYDRGLLKLEEMITRTYHLDQLPDAFEDMLSGKNAKGVISFP
ncbi:Zn-dependent alcohol dehydrogenase [Fulvivirga sp. M361]|uniref:Zn-dependent alcohol dehydrogenase n=1 Tax=Fulvivirga sp. M361 TaxID=2594266 RepID=UPI001179D071|nr:Zn-dependent alcohol dehydrogenase [Fulvivirga sp. M361]TRX60628.1 Zn-dependent alcohol dehydrogenase [Fulvivirga sp. M361]